MVATNLYVGDELFTISGSGYSTEGEVFNSNQEKVDANYSEALKISTMIGAYCTESGISKNGSEWEIAGDPTEAALMIAAKKMNYNCNNCTTDVDIPFESENQLMAVKSIIDGAPYVLAKGAPEKILARCTSMIDKNGNKIDKDENQLQKVIDEFSYKGLRVLALAYLNENIPEELTIDNLESLSFVGFAGIEDSVRPEVITAVEECHNAGIHVVMITGDHAKTAKAVSKAVGIGYINNEPEVIEGVELNKMSDDELYLKSPNIDVYARVAPHHKYRIVPAASEKPECRGYDRRRCK